MKYSWGDYMTMQRSLPSGSPYWRSNRKSKNEKNNKENDELDKITFDGSATEAVHKHVEKQNKRRGEDQQEKKKIIKSYLLMVKLFWTTQTAILLPLTKNRGTGLCSFALPLGHFLHKQKKQKFLNP